MTLIGPPGSLAPRHHNGLNLARYHHGYSESTWRRLSSTGTRSFSIITSGRHEDTVSGNFYKICRLLARYVTVMEDNKSALVTTVKKYVHNIVNLLQKCTVWDFLDMGFLGEKSNQIRMKCLYLLHHFQTGLFALVCTGLLVSFCCLKA